MIRAVLDLQKEKAVLLEQYLQISENIYQSELHQMDALLDTREEISRKVDACTLKMQHLCVDDTTWNHVRSLLQNEGNREAYEECWHPVFDQAQHNLAILARVQILNQEIVHRVVDAQNEIKEQLKAQQAVPVIEQYLQTGVQTVQGSVLSRKSSKA